ncbi:hypothetical protein DSO57_1034236 [Entomophthora muscae]|uniref:Uncharacterized protein n=1 Tax=Entomophthora muscae TaxID=34485 RepID=A0ACC2UA08_9FUNG|nr:hypothetical protein DSO57_1034236 [Entomophthora muscae]
MTLNLGLKAALQAWEDASFTKLQAELDESSREIAGGQQSYKEARKNLSDMTKAFRKASDDQKLVDVKSLLKAYQTEIDNLTKRIKSNETLILKVYSKVGDLPDPAPILNTSLAKSEEAASQENAKLELETKLNLANNSIQSLKEKLKENAGLQNRFDKLLEDQVAKKELEMQAENEANARQAREREEALQEKVRQLSIALEEQERSQALAQAKLLEGSVQGADLASSHLSQLELVLGELERARDQTASLRRENEGLRRQIQTPGEEGAVIMHSKADEMLQLQLENQEKELSRMLDQLDALKSEKASNEKANMELAESLKSQITANEKQVQELQAKISEMSDYQKIKNELEILKYIEFPEESEPADKQESGEESSAMAALVRKAKAQQQTITQLQNDSSQARTELKEALDQLQAASAQIKDLASLNARLESDLLAAPQGVSQESQPVATNTPPTGGLLPIVTSQRDRFRARNLELEENVRAAQDEINELQKSLSALKADNLQLYEQTKYASGYSENSSSNQAAHTTLSPEVYRDVSERYGSIYDETNNPFQEFRQREATRRYKTLNSTDRVALSLMRMFLANHVTRMVLVVYLLVLHILVVFTLLYLVNHSE